MVQTYVRRFNLNQKTASFETCLHMKNASMCIILPQKCLLLFILFTSVFFPLLDNVVSLCNLLFFFFGSFCIRSCEFAEIIKCKRQTLQKKNKVKKKNAGEKRKKNRFSHGVTMHSTWIANLKKKNQETNAER